MNTPMFTVYKPYAEGVLLSSPSQALAAKHAITSVRFARPVQFPCAYAFLNKPLII